MLHICLACYFDRCKKAHIASRNKTRSIGRILGSVFFITHLGSRMERTHLFKLMLTGGPSLNIRTSD